MDISFPKQIDHMNNEPTATEIDSSSRLSFWPQLKRFIAFQIKLYVDAIRDVFLSLLSVPAFIIDVIMQRHGDDSLFEQVLKLGRKSEKIINLFDQHDPAEQGEVSVDGVLRKVEEKILEEKQRR